MQWTANRRDIVKFYIYSFMYIYICLCLVCIIVYQDHIWLGLMEPRRDWNRSEWRRYTFWMGFYRYIHMYLCVFCVSVSTYIDNFYHQFYRIIYINVYSTRILMEYFYLRWEVIQFKHMLPSGNSNEMIRLVDFPHECTKCQENKVLNFCVYGVVGGKSFMPIFKNF